MDADIDFSRNGSRFGGFVRGALLGLVLTAIAAAAVSLATPPPADLPMPGRVEIVGDAPAVEEILAVPPIERDLGVAEPGAPGLPAGSASEPPAAAAVEETPAVVAAPAEAPVAATSGATTAAPETQADPASGAPAQAPAKTTAASEGRATPASLVPDNGPAAGVADPEPVVIGVPADGLTTGDAPAEAPALLPTDGAPVRERGVFLQPPGQ